MICSTDGICILGTCSEDSDCGSPAVCIEGICDFGCLQNHECPLGLVCKDLRCGPCSGISDCLKVKYMIHWLHNAQRWDLPVFRLVYLVYQTSTIVCLKLFFCKQLSLVVNKGGQRTTKMTINFFSLSVILKLRVEQHNSDFQSHFSMSKIDTCFSIFLHWRIIIKKLLLLSYFDNFDF